MPSGAAEGTAVIAVIVVVVGDMPCDMGSPSCRAEEGACTLAAVESCCPAGMALIATSKKSLNIVAMYA